MAPSPSSPFRRSVVQARHFSIALSRAPLGQGMTFKILSSAAKNADQPALWCGARGLAAGTPGTNSSRTWMPRGFFASGFFAHNTRSGTITVRAQ